MLVSAAAAATATASALLCLRVTVLKFMLLHGRVCKCTAVPECGGNQSAARKACMFAVLERNGTPAM
jgi:hypothetical protein